MDKKNEFLIFVQKQYSISFKDFKRLPDEFIFGAICKFYYEYQGDLEDYPLFIDEVINAFNDFCPNNAIIEVINVYKDKLMS